MTAHLASGAALALALLLPGSALAFPGIAGSARAAGSAAPAAGSAAPAAGSAAPAAGSASARPANPHAAPPGARPRSSDPQAQERRFVEQLSAMVPKDQVVARIVDPEGKPLAGREVTLEVTFNSVAAGTSQSRKAATTDKLGMVRFKGLTTGSFYSYAVVVKEGDGVYTSEPQRLDGRTGRFVGLRIYPVTNDADDLRMAAGAQIVIEPKAADFKVEVGVTIQNGSPKSWVPKDLVLQLPPGGILTEFPEEGPLHFARQGDSAVRLVGTVTPGTHKVMYRFRVRNGGVSRLELPVQLPPLVVQADVYALAAEGMELKVPQGRPMKEVRDRRGLPFLHQRVDSRTPMSQARITLSSIPVRGRGSWVALGLAAVLALGGLALALLQAGPRRSGARTLAEDELAAARELLLDELVSLEKAHREGEVGPKTYGANRRRLEGALARLEARSGTQPRRAVRRPRDPGKRRRGERSRAAGSDE